MNFFDKLNAAIARNQTCCLWTRSESRDDARPLLEDTESIIPGLWTGTYQIAQTADLVCA